ncbi:helix-turn-helix domain-containing protein [Pseudonocardia sp. HH130630-07]|uniref:helix-turn-helix domain-containing protein n=1 Tax=Pseudonocardia sp. HH130630-07 TaxID=1690815 RepID=UPI0012EAEF51|nr:leucine zipper domain-containing protein [Pseudonocardia sp. HH130630-07]
MWSSRRRSSRATVYKWIRRYHAEGWAGLIERSSRPRRCPTRTSTEVENRVLELCRLRHRGPMFLAGELGWVASTVGRILARHHAGPLAATDPITGAPVRQRRSGRRYQRSRPGELLHIDGWPPSRQENPA